MSVFGKIKSAIFGHAKAEELSGGAAASFASAAAPKQDAAAETAHTGLSPASGAAAPISNVDVEGILKKLSDSNSQKLNWRTSIVDLMKLLDLDSRLSARKELAQELKYLGDTIDSAKMNVWLHKQVMLKLAESGGKVPDSLKARA